MFGSLANLGSLLQQARQVGSRVQELQQQLKQRRTTGTAGGAMVEVDANGAQELTGCRISPKLFADGDRELIEDLVVSAANQALDKARQLQAEAMRDLTGGLELPGLKEALARMLPSGPDGPQPPAP